MGHDVQKQLMRRGADWILLQHPGQKNRLLKIYQTNSEQVKPQ
jgi:hypothetical protein